MNGCAHHAIANIGFHAMSMKVGKFVLPAMQVLLAGGPTGYGSGRLAEKIIKIPSRRVPDALRAILEDFKKYAQQDELFNSYCIRLSNNYFYNLPRPLGDVSQITQEYLTALGWASPVRNADRHRRMCCSNDRYGIGRYRPGA